MDGSPKSNIQLNNKQLAELQGFLRTGYVFPVTIEKQIAQNYYAVRIRNVALNAYSEVDLRSKKVFVRVKEIQPVPKLQLLFYNEEDSINRFWKDEFSNLDYFDFIRLQQVLPYLPQDATESSDSLTDPKVVKTLLHWLDLKSCFSLIPLSQCFKSDLNIQQLDRLYHFAKTSNSSACLVRYPSRQNEITAEIPELDLFNHSISSETFQLERWFVPVGKQTLSMAVETAYDQGCLSRFSSCVYTENYGRIFLNGRKQQNWKIQIDFENSIYQRSFVPDFQDFSQRISQTMKQNVDLISGIVTPVRLDQAMSFLDRTVHD